GWRNWESEQSTVIYLHHLHLCKWWGYNSSVRTKEVNMEHIGEILAGIGTLLGGIAALIEALRPPKD
ncbi:hypothetical protein QP168_10625, partial [Aerococcus urinae]|uniref:hypothetical protein n=1 Tax=Aerococcus urinae TaxID=1376 RepID=UPI00254D7068